MRTLLLFGTLVVIFFVGCTSVSEGQLEPKQARNVGSMQSEGSIGKERVTDSEAPIDWREVVLKDVSTGRTFKLLDFDKPVLIESFAVWCPTCTKQQNEVKALHDDIGDEVVSVAIDTDPNEDEQKVIDHAQKNGFDWLYVVSPVELTRSLIDEFGIDIVNAPQAPMILICGDHAKLLKKGVKTAEELSSEIAGCGI